MLAADKRGELVRVVGRRVCRPAPKASSTCNMEGDWELDATFWYWGHMGAGWEGSYALGRWGGGTLGNSQPIHREVLSSFPCS